MIKSREIKNVFVQQIYSWYQQPIQIIDKVYINGSYELAMMRIRGCLEWKVLFLKFCPPPHPCAAPSLTSCYLPKFVKKILSEEIKTKYCQGAQWDTSIFIGCLFVTVGKNLPALRSTCVLRKPGPPLRATANPIMGPFKTRQGGAAEPCAEGFLSTELTLHLWSPKMPDQTDCNIVHTNLRFLI